MSAPLVPVDNSVRDVNGEPLYETGDDCFLRDINGRAYFDDGSPVYLDVEGESSDVVEGHRAILKDLGLMAHDDHATQAISFIEWTSSGREVHDRPTEFDSSGARIGNTPNRICIVEFPYNDEVAQSETAKFIASACRSHAVILDALVGMIARLDNIATRKSSHIHDAQTCAMLASECRTALKRAGVEGVAMKCPTCGCAAFSKVVCDACGGNTSCCAATYFVGQREIQTTVCNECIRAGATFGGVAEKLVASGLVCRECDTRCLGDSLCLACEMHRGAKRAAKPAMATPTETKVST